MKKKKKKRKNKKKNTKYYVLLFLLLIILTILLSNNGYFDNLKGVSANIFNINQNQKMNKNVINAEVNDLEKQINDLKKLNNIDELLTDKIVINASILRRSTPYWNDIIIINKGKKDGIKKGYAAMSNDGFIGEITSVHNDTSEISLITNSNKSSISAKFNYEGNDYFGTISKYSLIKNELYLENVIGDFDKKKLININVITSGLSSNIPSGLLIGKIIDIKKDKYNLSNSIKIELSANLNDINLVRVVGIK